MRDVVTISITDAKKSSPELVSFFTMHEISSLNELRTIVTSRIGDGQHISLKGDHGTRRDVSKVGHSIIPIHELLIGLLELYRW